MSRTWVLAGLLGCLPWAPGTPAAGERPASRVELRLLVLDEESLRWTSHEETQGEVVREEITFLPPERGAFVAMEMDCGPAAPGPCHPGRPLAVLTTLEGLKRFLAALPPGSSVEWGLSCMGPWPREYPLSTSEASAEVERFAAAHHVKFVIYKAG